MGTSKDATTNRKRGYIATMVLRYWLEGSMLKSGSIDVSRVWKSERWSNINTQEDGMLEVVRPMMGPETREMLMHLTIMDALRQPASEHDTTGSFPPPLHGASTREDSHPDNRCRSHRRYTHYKD
jgi:hypothetical protein